MSGANVRGCLVADDLAHVLGDAEEAQFAAALTFMDTGSCPVGSAPSKTTQAKMQKMLGSVAGDINVPSIPGRILR